MSTESRLRDLCRGLAATTATERKRSCEALGRELLSDAAHSFLSSTRDFTWTYLFQATHDHILKESEKANPDQSSHKNIEINCSSLLITIISGANKDLQYVNCEKVIECSLEILKCSRLVRIVGDLYIRVLSKHTLCYKYYLERITPFQWADLLDAGVNICNRGSIDALKASQILTMIMKEGVKRCHLILPIRDNLNSIEQLFTSKMAEKKDHLQEILLEIAILVTKNVAAESRLAICIFTETTLPFALQFYRQTSNAFKSKKILLFKFLHVCLLTHHPKGRLGDEAGCLAGDWNVWNSLLTSIHQLVIAESSSIKCSFSLASEEHEVYKYFVILAVEICHQDFNSKLAIESAAGESSSKKMKLDIHDFSSLSQILNHLTQHFQPWADIIKEYVYKYGHYITEYEITLFLEALCVHFCSNSFVNEEILFYEIIINIYETIDRKWNESFNDPSIKIWNGLLRKASVQSNVFNICHKAIKSILSLKSFHPPMDLLINLFFEKSLLHTYESIYNLDLLLNNYNTRISDVMRLEITHWALTDYSSLCYRNQISCIFFKLCLKENMVLKNRENKTHNVFSDIFEDFENLMLISDFEMGLLFKDAEICDENTSVEMSTHTICKNTFNSIKNMLDKNISEKIGKCKESNIFIPDILGDIDIILKWINFFLNHNLSIFSDFKDITVKVIGAMDILNTYLHLHFYNYCEGVHEKTELLNKLKSLYDYENYSSDVLIFIRDKTYKEIIEFLCGLLNDDTKDADEFILVETTEIVENPFKRLVTEILLNYNFKKSRYTNTTLRFLLRDGLYDLQNKSDFNIAINVVSFITNNLRNDIEIVAVVSLMAKMCKTLYRDDEASFQILLVLYDIFLLFELEEASNTRENCLIILKSLMKRCKEHYYSPKTMGQTLKCLLLVLSKSKASNHCDINHEMLFKSLNSNIQSIRLYASYCISYFIAAVDPNKIDELFELIPNIFSLDATDISSTVISDEGANRTSTVLHFLGAVAVTSSKWDKKCLSAIIKIGCDKNISLKLQEKVFKLIASVFNIQSTEELIFKNISYLISFWYKEERPIDAFPWSLTGCKSIDDFYATFKHILIPLAIYWIHSNEKNTIIKNMLQMSKSSEKDFFNECISFLMMVCLSTINSNDLNGDIKYLKKVLNQQFGHHISIPDEETLHNMMIKNMSEILYDLLIKIFDESQLIEDFEWSGSLPFFIEPMLTKDRFCKIINAFNVIFEQNIISYVCINDPACIQKLILKLWSDVETHHTLERRLTSLHHLWIFCETLEFNTNLNTFLCFFITRILFSTINKYKNDVKFQILSITSLKIFYKLLNIILPGLSNTLAHFFPLIITTLTQIMQHNSNLKADALKILNVLIRYMSEHFKNVKCMLDPNLDYLSNANEELQNLMDPSNVSLKEYIEDFINADNTGRSESSQILYQKLIANRKELIEMIHDLKEIRGFSEDCKTSHLHRLMCILTENASNDNYENLSLQACRCLGEIGPINCQTLVLKLPHDFNHIDNPIMCLTYVTFMEIKELIFDENPNIIKAASKSLTSILCSKEGKTILESLDDRVSKDLMIPFLTKKKIFTETTFKILNPLFDTYLDCPEIWYDLKYKKHSEWIADLVLSILKCFADQKCFLTDLIELVEICRAKPQISEKIFLPLIGLIISLGNVYQINTIKKHVQKFFNQFYEKTFISSEKSNVPQNQDTENNANLLKYGQPFERESVECMLQLVQFIRLQISNYENVNFSLNYLPIAWAAHLNGAYFMSILYCELWCDSAMDGIPSSNSDCITKIPNGDDMLSILRMNYKSIGDNDALSGCGFAHLTDSNERKDYYMSARCYTDALLMHDMLLSNDRFAAPESQNISIKNFAHSLHSSGLYYLANKFIQNCEPGNLFDGIKYDCFWRLGDWNLDVEFSSSKSKPSSFDNGNILDTADMWSAHHYNCLKNALGRDIDSVDFKLSDSLKRARKHVAFSYKQNALEGCQSFYQLASKFQSLQEIEYYMEIKSQKKELENVYQELINTWSDKNILPFRDFQNIEPILSQRLIILEHIAKHSADINFKLSLANLQLNYAELALQHKWSHASNRWINKASQIAHNLTIKQDLNQESLFQIKTLKNLVNLVEGKTAWNSGHTEVALYLVKSIISNDKNIDDTLKANALMQYGLWMVETRRESPQDILNNYLKKSLDVLGSNENQSAKLNAYLAIARFADSEYKQIDTYMKSSAFRNKIKYMEKCNDAVLTLKEKYKKKDDLTKEERKAMLFNDRQGDIDRVEIKNTQNEREQYLQLAMRYYLLTLLNGEENNLCVFRIISLWLDNPMLELDQTDDDKSLSEFFQTIPSWKFIPILPQLAPRLNYTKGSMLTFQEDLYNLIEKCATEHPHHCLPILLALKNSYKDVEINKKSHSSTVTEGNSDDAYVATAKRMILSISHKGNGLANIIKEMEVVIDAMIKLANYKVEKPTSNKQKIPRSESLRSLSHLTHVLIPTITLPIRYNGDYKNIPSVESFSDEFLLVGGVNAPKRISCRGSDGLSRNMLLKGDDDIRQDAVMQQVFGIVNHLLDKNNETKQDRLIIRTYKIVAFSRRCGILEWCDGTEPIGRILTGNNGSSGYHSKFRPQDIPPRKARELMVNKRSGTNGEKLNVFKKILSQFKPVFHHFFTENFLTPAVWYERRLAYTHSVATSSMTGYILGLGDRHVQNILVDESTAEVIHIDFGIAFEQGKLQPTPETIPFRLTQDMIAGFGCTGVEGVFRRSCEKTMDVLKSNKETLTTILEVLLCDPLYIWIISDKQAYKKQDLVIPEADLTLSCVAEGGEGNSVSAAERVLSVVKNKLKGDEFGCMLATSGQVARLIQQATDINNLSRLFPGWQPYL